MWLAKASLFGSVSAVIWPSRRRAIMTCEMSTPFHWPDDGKHSSCPTSTSSLLSNGLTATSAWPRLYMKPPAAVPMLSHGVVDIACGVRARVEVLTSNTRGWSPLYETTAYLPEADMPAQSIEQSESPQLETTSAGPIRWLGLGANGGCGFMSTT